MWHGRFREDTAEIVQHFTQSLDLDWRLAPYDVYGSIAHVRMLEHVGLLEQHEAAVIEDGLRQVLKDIQEGRFKPLESMEDVHMNIEARLTEIIGPVGAKLHMGRSRNDQSATAVRLYLRKEMYSVGDGLITLLDALLDRATAHRHLIIPGYTHLQQAQPVSMGHYWLAHFWALARDFRRVLFALESVNECPLGSGALAGSTLPLDRGFTTVMLGFDRTSDNSMDSVAHRDHLLDCQYAMTVLMLHASRMAEDLVVYNSREFGWIILPDAFCTGSSMMPQKKNPDVLELVRGRTGRVIGDLVDLLTIIKGLPLTYNRDMQEDKEPFLDADRTVSESLALMAGLLREIGFVPEAMRAALKRGFLNATELADYLAAKGLPFREAHHAAGAAVAKAEAKGCGLEDLSLAELKGFSPLIEADVFEALRFETAVARRNAPGGTGPDSVARQIEDLRIWLAALEASGA